MKYSRFHIVLAFIALMLLRVTVGFHFFKEGADKIQNGFTAEYFLRAAKGPFAPYFHAMLEDENGALKFGLTRDSESGKRQVKPELTLALWDDFLDRASEYYKFGDVDLEQKLIVRSENLKDRIQTARREKDKSVNTRELEEIRSDTLNAIVHLREQKEKAEGILQVHVDEFVDWMNINRIDLIAYFETESRLDGFERDGPSKGKVAVYVESLRDQVTSISYDRNKQKSGWANEIDAMWDSFENQVNGLAVDSQAAKPPLQIHRPFSQPNSWLKWINFIIPWFDFIVGSLLILGLFTRLASFCGATFLLSVIATQPPWIPGTESTYLYAIEFMALVVIFATLAGRIGGLDFFFSGRNSGILSASNNNEQTGN